jgi:hypothetical protein
LAERADQCVERPIERAHEISNSWDKLFAIYDYLIDAKVLDLGLDLKPLALCPDDRGVVHAIGDAPYLPEPDAAKLLNGAAIRYVAPEVCERQTYRAFLLSAGVSRLGPEAVRDVLTAACPEEGHITDAPAWLRDVRRLRDLYRYFNHHADELGPTGLERLRVLPFVLTQGGRLAAADSDPPLLVPPHAAGTDNSLPDLLGADHLISDRVLDGETRRFFTDCLGRAAAADSRHVQPFDRARRTRPHRTYPNDAARALH